MNNSSFGYDCRSNADNCFLAPVFDEIEELSHVKRYQNVLDLDISEFAYTELFERETEELACSIKSLAVKK